MAREYDSEQAVYRDGGVIIAWDMVLDEIDRYLETLHRRSLGAVERALDGDLPLEMLERYLMRDVKDGFIATYLIGRGGRNMMTQADWDRVEEVIQGRYEFIRNLMRQAADGLLSESEFLRRWRMYYNNMVNGFWMGHQKGHLDAGYTEMRRLLNSRIPCSDCPQYAAQDWQPIGVLPLPTEDCECGANCLCTVEYR